MNCSSNLNLSLQPGNFESLSQSLEQFFLTVGQNNFGNKTPFPIYPLIILIFNQSQIVRARIRVLIILPLIIPSTNMKSLLFLAGIFAFHGKVLSRYHCPTLTFNLFLVQTKINLQLLRTDFGIYH